MTCLKVNNIKVYETLSGGGKANGTKLKTALWTEKLLKCFSTEIVVVVCSSIQTY